jgi:hypothetical protein
MPDLGPTLANHAAHLTNNHLAVLPICYIVGTVGSLTIINTSSISF